MRTLFDKLGALNPGLPPGREDTHDEAALRKRYRSIFISDLHLGTPGCQAAALLDFLRAHPSDYLYLVATSWTAGNCGANGIAQGALSAGALARCAAARRTGPGVRRRRCVCR